MPDFLTILAFYYACDQAAMTGALTSEQIHYCTAAYDQVKVRFLTEDEIEALSGLSYADRAVRLRKGYLRFKNWEAANPDVVGLLKRRALGQMV